ncbi:MAG: pyridoxamine 5'-phosphate oxidase family protein [Chloroflexota bacterium]
MKKHPHDDSIQNRLNSERNIWFATVRPDGKPHLVPLWFIWQNETFYVCIQPDSIKAKNLELNSQVALSLEDGSSVVICEGKATAVQKPWLQSVQNMFLEKYDWSIATSVDYTLLVAIKPTKWLIW